MLFKDGMNCDDIPINALHINSFLILFTGKLPLPEVYKALHSDYITANP
jgi:hypothetical protein